MKSAVLRLLRGVGANGCESDKIAQSPLEAAVRALAGRQSGNLVGNCLASASAPRHRRPAALPFAYGHSHPKERFENQADYEAARLHRILSREAWRRVSGNSSGRAPGDGPASSALDA